MKELFYSGFLSGFCAVKITEKGIESASPEDREELLNGIYHTETLEAKDVIDRYKEYLTEEQLKLLENYSK